MEFAPEWAPNIHPLLVHFPIALLISAAAANLLSFFLPDKWWEEQKNTILYTVGALSAIVVFYTGRAAADSVFLPAEAQSVLSEHADWALWTVWFFALYALLRIGFHWFKLMDKLSFKIIAFITVLPGLFMISETAEYGGKMVFGYGAGTGQLLEPENTTELNSTDSSYTAPSSFKTLNEGGFTWEIQSDAVSEMIRNFRWIEGEPGDLNPRVIQSGDEYLLRFSAKQEANFFVTRNQFRDIQADYYLRFNDFEGEVKLVHHVQDADNYDFVSLNSGGSITQGRMINGETTVFEEGSYDPSGLLFIRVVGDGTHFRGYLNKEMVVHGHGDAPEAGSAGLLVQGTGTVLLSKMELTEL